MEIWRQYITNCYSNIVFRHNFIIKRTQAQVKLADQANKACFLLHKRPSKFKNMPVSVIMDLFDKYIGAILNYSCEVWGFHNAQYVEQVHLSFCKRVLGVKKTTQNDFVYGELERVPMSIERYIRVLNYWLKIVTGEKSALVYAVYQEGLRSIDDSCKYSWCRSVRTMLFQFGFGDALQSRSWKCWCVLQMFSSKGIRYLQTRMNWQTVWFNVSWFL